jgi:hypothetical protein
LLGTVSNVEPLPANWRHHMKIYLGMIPFEWFRNPLRLELVRHVVPLVVFVFFISLGLGYAWAMAAFRSFPR